MKDSEKNMITICIPVYNREEMVKKTLNSIRRQTYRPLNVVLVDNNSTDSTLKTLVDWKHENEGADFVIEVLEEPTPGASVARNRALEIVRTPWTLFFDSDDVMPENHIERIMEAINENPGLDVVGWGMKIFFANGKMVKKGFKEKNPKFNNLFHSIFSTQAYAARTNVYREAGGWDESLSMGDDIELGSRILALKPKMRLIENHFVEVFESARSITTTSGIIQLKDSLEKIRQTLRDKHRHWVDLQILIKCATWAKNDPQSSAVAREIFMRTHGIRHILWRLLYFYGRFGGRGIARFYEILCGADIE